MKTIGILAGAAALLAMTGTAMAEEAQQAQQEAPKEKKICRSERMTGSLTRVRRTCLTQREWDQLAESTRRSINGLERDANQRQSVTNNSFNTPGG